MPALLALWPLTDFACAFLTLMTLIVPVKALNQGDLPVDVAAGLASWSLAKPVTGKGKQCVLGSSAWGSSLTSAPARPLRVVK